MKKKNIYQKYFDNHKKIRMEKIEKARKINIRKTYLFSFLFICRQLEYFLFFSLKLCKTQIENAQKNFRFLEWISCCCRHQYEHTHSNIMLNKYKKKRINFAYTLNTHNVSSYGKIEQRQTFMAIFFFMSFTILLSFLLLTFSPPAKWQQNNLEMKKKIKRNVRKWKTTTRWAKLTA